MSMKHHTFIIFVSMIFSCGALFAAGMTESVISAVGGSDVFYFMYPFYILPIALAEVSWKRLLIFCIMIGIESWVVHRMLKKTCTVVVPRMIAVNLVEVLVQLLMFIPVGLLYRSVGLIKVASLATVINLFIRFVPALMVFYVRWITACKVYARFDSSVNARNLRMAMLWANGLSYAYLVAVFVASSYVSIL